MRTVYETSTRRAVVDLLKRERRYLTAAAIYHIVRASHPKIALSTVYRTLELLTGLGSVSSRTDTAGEASFVFCTDERHHHAICTVCGHVDEIDCGSIDALRIALLARQGFALDGNAIEFFGRCARCR